MRALGVVLAGGRSTRFGPEKAVAEHGGRPMIAWVADALSGCEAIAVNAPERSGAAAWARRYHHPLLPDAPGSPDGPLAGVLEGLRWAAGEGGDILMTAPCDTPGLPHDFAARLSQAVASAPCAYAVTPSGPHPPCAAWRVDRLPLLAAALADGHPSIRRLLDSWGAVRVAFASDLAFANVNTLADLGADASSPPRTAP